MARLLAISHYNQESIRIYCWWILVVVGVSKTAAAFGLENSALFSMQREATTPLLPALSLTSCGKHNENNNSNNKLEYSFIEDPGHFLSVCQEELSTAPVLAFDIECEFNRYRYGEHLCLLQLSNGKNIFIIDPTTVGNLDALWEILENPEVPVVCHGPSSDLRLLDKLYGRRPNNLFDTEMAARLLGYEKLSLSYLLEQHFGQEKQSKMAKANWNVRPLSPKMLDYAALDVAYLHGLRNVLVSELHDLGRLEWHSQECRALEQRIRYNSNNQTRHLRLKGSQYLDTDEAHMLQYLFDARNAVARTLDKPAYHIISNQRLLDLARDPPRRMNEWKKLRGVHPHVRKQAFRDFHRAVVQAQTSSPPPPETMEMPGQQEKARKRDALYPILEQIQQVYPDIYTTILSSKTIERIAAGEINFVDLREWQRSIIMQMADKVQQNLSFLLLSD